MEPQELEEEARQYLENFWNPQIGSTVRIRKKKGIFKIERWEPKYPEQIFLKERRELAYAQDLEWLPTDDEIRLLLQQVGIKIVDNGLQLGKTFRPLPQNCVEAADILRTYRQLRLMTDGTDPYLVLLEYKTE